ncbi:transporter, major facilitator family [Coleofasciculus chthonoplastes PCC 7420]|uniref:Transporter, major facilitator family n=1 Tax=Coleofasciculus chthonoplastes PCC 7420 TaxID=118168 RepID=B4VYD8_9CYAN|nr:MFS transporter [Coleofasciculus chthonoplastes]EDX73030.1 transporter, major facilitator family [Coleofasciculus chthonoplastes PCC 7420]
MLRDPRLLVLLVAGSLTTMAGGVVAPILPEMIQQLNLDPALAGNLVSLHCLTIALFSPPLGIVADRIGHLRVLIPSLILYALFGTAGAFMHSLMPLLVVRGLLGAASGGIAAASLGILGNMYEGEARSQALGYATSTLTIMGIAFPLLGGWVGSFHWQWAFGLYGIGLPMAILAARFLPEKSSPKTKADAKDAGSKLRQVLGRPYTLRLLCTLSLVSIAMYAVVIYAPQYLKQTIDATSVVNGIVLASRAIGAAIISAFGAKRLAQRWGRPTTVAIGLGLMALTLSTIPILHQLGWILVTAVFFGMGFGLVLPTLYGTLANLAPPDLKSSVLAAGTGAGFLGQFISPILLGPVLAFCGLEWVFYAAAIVALLAGLLLFAHQQ